MNHLNHVPPCHFPNAMRCTCPGPTIYVGDPPNSTGSASTTSIGDFRPFRGFETPLEPQCPFPDHHPKCADTYVFTLGEPDENGLSRVGNTFECGRLAGHIGRHRATAEETGSGGWTFEWDA